MSISLLEFARLDMGRRYSVGVVGDAMIDQYYDVEVKGVSPEFPIPVMVCPDDKPVERPGGAANVAYQFLNFQFDTWLVSLLDTEARQCMFRCGVKSELSRSISGRNPRKKRLYSNGFPLCRLDIEDREYGLGEESLRYKTSEMWDILELQSFDAVIFSDYGKGLLTDVRQDVLRKFPISVVDPKLGDIARWRGCTVFKPNEAEAMRLSGETTVSAAGSKLVSLLGSTVVVTQAGKGVSVFRPGCEEVFLSPKVRSGVVESVIGAGDCFVAFMTMALCRGADILDAVMVAFEAGTLYVRNKHNEPLSPRSILAAIDPPASKLVEPKHLLRRDYRLVFTNGCFDVMHPGHLHSLRHARSHGDRLVVAVNTDDSVSRLKPGRPIQPLADRLEMLQACEYVDFVVVFDDDTPERVIREIMPDVVAKGGEYEESSIVGSGIVPEIIRIPMLPDHSTTRLLDRVRRMR